jgi:8-oxo-dGTP diphosphatase
VKYPCPVLAADAIVIRPNKQTNEPEVLLNTRGIEPYKGLFVFPGGHVDYNEAPIKACIRELKEETNLDGSDPELLTVAGDAQRDPRKHVVTVAYLVKVPQDQQPKGGDDAADAQFYPVKDILKQKDRIGFDHYEILQLALQRLNIKISE